MDYPIHVYNPRTAGKPVICLGHANGFPAEVYAPLAEALGTDYHVVCLPSRPWWGDVETFTGWPMLADDLVGGIQRHKLAPVVIVGHSMNGVAATIAATSHPELFKALVLLDPVFVPRWVLWILRYLGPLGMSRQKRLVEGARKRRREWESMDAAYAYFRERHLFKGCSDEVVRLYTEGMMRPNGSGVTLAYDPEWEARIFDFLPPDLWRYPPLVSAPMLALGGEDSDTFVESAVRYLQRVSPNTIALRVPGTGHMLPLQKPDVVAARILKFLADKVNAYAR